MYCCKSMLETKMREKDQTRARLKYARHEAILEGKRLCALLFRHLENKSKPKANGAEVISHQPHLQGDSKHEMKCKNLVTHRLEANSPSMVMMVYSV